MNFPVDGFICATHTKHGRGTAGWSAEQRGVEHGDGGVHDSGQREQGDGAVFT